MEAATEEGTRLCRELRITAPRHLSAEANLGHLELRLERSDLVWSGRHNHVNVVIHEGLGRCGGIPADESVANNVGRRGDESEIIPVIPLRLKRRPVKKGDGLLTKALDTCNPGWVDVGDLILLMIAALRLSTAINCIATEQIAARPWHVGHVDETLARAISKVGPLCRWVV